MNPTQTSLITDQQRLNFEEQGYFVTDVLFDEVTLEAVRSEFLRIWQEHIEASVARSETDQQLMRYRPFLIRLHESSSACNSFCRHPVFMQLCRELIGPDADMTWNQAILKPPAPTENSFTDNSFAWHQDQWYALKGDYARDSNLEILESASSGFTAWVAISRTIVDNGTLWVLPGRHREGLLPHIWNEERREWVGQFDTSWKIPAVMQPGQMLVFNKYLPHGSSANVSPETRMAYQIGFNRPGLKLGPSPDVVPLLRDGEAV